MKTSVKKCTCKHEFQDARYGNGNRLHNHGIKGTGGEKTTCTVCGTSTSTDSGKK